MTKKEPFNAIINFSNIWVDLSCGKRSFQALKLIKGSEQVKEFIKWLEDNYK